MPKTVSFATLAVAVLLVGAGTLGAQEFQPFGDIDVHYDMQWFAPPIIDEYGGEPVEANVGWFFEMNKLYMSVQAPRPSIDTDFTSQGIVDGDSTYAVDDGTVLRGPVDLLASNGGQSLIEDARGWGNRYDVGYMTTDRHGWLVSIWDMNNASTAFNRNILRIDQLDFDLDADPDDIAARFRLFQRVSLNQTKVGSIELNKTFRMPPQAIHHRDGRGVYFEHFAGLRYADVNDRTGLGYEDTDLGEDADGPDLLDGRQTYVATTGEWQNEMLGFQLGTRFYTRRGHWIVSGEARGFGLYNWQTFNFRRDRMDLFFEDGTLANLTGVVSTEDTTYLQEQFNEFVPGGELRIEAAYELTREIRAQAGLQYLYFGRGIGRGFDSFNRTGSTFNSEDLTMLGISLGLEINR